MRKRRKRKMFGMYLILFLLGCAAGCFGSEKTSEAAVIRNEREKRAQSTAEAEGHAGNKDGKDAEAEARKKAEELYCFETDACKKEVNVQYLINSICYREENVRPSENGGQMVLLYRGEYACYETAYSEALCGLLFFSAPKILFFKEEDGTLSVWVETKERFTREKASENDEAVLHMLDMIAEVKRETKDMGEAEKAQFICDYVANRLSYDSSFQKNCLGDALQSGMTACAGYNAVTSLLFSHGQIPYANVMARTKVGGISHVFGKAVIEGDTFLFDTANYDREDGKKDAYWIFSNWEKQGAYYDGFSVTGE